MICPICSQAIQIGDWPFCPHEHGSPMIASDDIPGGLEVRHGICNPDGSPKKYYSKSEIKKAAYDKGLFIMGDTPKVNSKLKEEDHARRETKGN